MPISREETDYDPNAQEQLPVRRRNSLQRLILALRDQSKLSAQLKHSKMKNYNPKLDNPYLGVMADTDYDPNK